MGQFDQLTDTELAQLSEHAYRWAMRFYDSGEAVMREMTQMATWTPRYAELNAQVQVIGAAARERSEQREATARLATIDLGDDEAWAMIREAQDIDAADRRDDPLMRES